MTTSSLSTLIEQRDELERQIHALAKEQRVEIIEKIRALMAEGNLTLTDLGAPATARSGAPAGPTKKVEPKFRDANGNSWSGRGLKPKWMKAALEAGATIDSLRI